MSSDSVEWFDFNSRITRPAAKLLGLPHVPIKEIGRDELPFIVAHLIALNPDDRRLRFGQYLTDAAIAKYSATIDFERDGVFGVYDEDLQLRALCHVATIENSTVKLAELGLSIHEHFRGNGIGSLLFSRAKTFARNAHIERIFIHCLSENRAMRHIATKAGMTQESMGGEVDAQLLLKPAHAGTHMKELLQEQLAGLDYVVKQHVGRIKNWTDELLPAGIPEPAQPRKRRKKNILPPIG